MSVDTANANDRAQRCGASLNARPDHLGSTSVSYNTSTGAVSAQRYTPYGAPRGPASALPTDYQFTGQRSEEAGLGSLYDYNNARFYSPALGRFLSPDTLVPEPGNPQSLNRYAYVWKCCARLRSARPLVFTRRPAVRLDAHIRPFMDVLRKMKMVN